MYGYAITDTTKILKLEYCIKKVLNAKLLQNLWKQLTDTQKGQELLACFPIWWNTNLVRRTNKEDVNM